jgi:hypothetical protein
MNHDQDNGYGKTFFPPSPQIQIQFHSENPANRTGITLCQILEENKNDFSVL